MKPKSFLPAQKSQEYEKNQLLGCGLLLGFSYKPPKTQETHNSRYKTKRDDVEKVSNGLTRSSCAIQTKPMANKRKPCQTLAASATKPEDGDDEYVSTELTLSCGPMANKRKSCVTLAASNPEDGDDDDVSTELTLSCGPMANKRKSCVTTKPESWFCSKKRNVTSTNAPWIIKKQLTESDLGGMSRLLVPKNLVEKHILPVFGATEIESREGMRVRVWDQDSQSEHELVFKKWSSWTSYVFNRNWRKDFVVRRELKQGDLIGLDWDSGNSSFNFCLLKRA